MRIARTLARWAPLAVLFAASSTSAQGLEQGLEQELKDVTWIGFQQFQEVSRVFVRTTEPVQYRVENAKPNLIVLVLENARVPIANNQSHLDTRYFESPVTFVQPRVIEGPSPSVRIEITLRQKVPFKEIQNDTFLALDFERPQ